MMQFYIRDYKNLSEIFSIILSRLWKFTYLGGPGTHLWPIRSLKWVWLMCRKMLNHGWPPSTTWCGKDSKNWWNCCGYEPRRVSGTYSVSQEYGPDNWWQLPSILCTYTPFSPLKQQKRGTARYSTYKWLMVHERPRSELRCDLQTGFLWQLYKPHLRHGNGLGFPYASE